jgi:hypothetical protein
LIFTVNISTADEILEDYRDNSCEDILFVFLPFNSGRAEEKIGLQGNPRPVQLLHRWSMLSQSLHRYLKWESL